MKIEEERVAYTGFAEVYDQFMDNVPYGEWAEYLAGLLKEYGCENCLLVDLGCGDVGYVVSKAHEQDLALEGIHGLVKFVHHGEGPKSMDGEQCLRRLRG